MRARLFNGTNHGALVEVKSGDRYVSLFEEQPRRRPFFFDYPKANDGGWAYIPPDPIRVETYNLYWAHEYGRPICKFGVLSGLKYTDRELDNYAREAMYGER